METIKNYLEAMFANMPNTEAVKKAKSELLQMMEDKYNELIEEGQSVNTAVGTVISEFGNLDELAEDLGIRNEVDINVKEEEEFPRRTVILEEAKEYIKYKKSKGFKTGIGVMLCIMCVIFPIISDILCINEIFGVIGMFACIAVAIGIFITSSMSKNSSDFIDKTLCQIDMTTAQYVSEQQNNYNSTHALRITIGVILCALCWLPAAVLDAANLPSELTDFGGCLLFIMIGVGVLLIIQSSEINKSYEKLLGLNDKTKISGNYVPEKQLEYISEGGRLTMELFWPVTTSIYLIWSFITFEWWKTWIVWVIAAIIHAILKKTLVRR